jgi:hypothetical protein
MTQLAVSEQAKPPFAAHGLNTTTVKSILKYLTTSIKANMKTHSSDLKNPIRCRG